MADRDLKTVLYTDDQGVQWRTKQDAAIIAQQNDLDAPITGAVALNAADDHEEIPRGLKPRGVYVDAAGHKSRFVVCMTKDAPLYHVGGAHDVTSVDLQQLGGAAVTYTRSKAKRERDYRKAGKPVGS